MKKKHTDRRPTLDPQPETSRPGSGRVARGSQEPRRARPGGPLNERVSGVTVQRVGPGARTQGQSRALPLPWG